MQSQYFELSEFDCPCGCGANHTKPEHLRRLTIARRIAGVPFVVNCGTRCKRFNTSLPGAGNDSEHLTGEGSDIKTADSPTRYAVLRGLIGAGFTRIEFGPNYIHAGSGPTKPQGVAWYSPLLTKE